MAEKSSYKKQLDAFERKQRNKILFSILCACILLFGGYALYISYMAADKPKVVTGTALSIAESPNAKRSEVYIFVKLENGNTVKTIFPSGNRFNKGDIVFLHEQTTKAFGAKRYSYIKTERNN